MALLPRLNSCVWFSSQLYLKIIKSLSFLRNFSSFTCCGPFSIHLLPHVHAWFDNAALLLLITLVSKFKAIWAEIEYNWITIESYPNKGISWSPHAIRKWQKSGAGNLSSLVSSASESNRTIMWYPAEHCSVFIEADSVNPTTIERTIFCEQLTKRKSSAPFIRARFGFKALDVRREYTTLTISGASSQKIIVRVPRNRNNRRSYWLFDVFRHPPKNNH